MTHYARKKNNGIFIDPEWADLGPTVENLPQPTPTSSIHKNKKYKLAQSYKIMKPNINIQKTEQDPKISLNWLKDNILSSYFVKTEPDHSQTSRSLSRKSSFNEDKQSIPKSTLHNKFYYANKPLITSSKYLNSLQSSNPLKMNQKFRVPIIMIKKGSTDNSMNISRPVSTRSNLNLNLKSCQTVRHDFSPDRQKHPNN